MVHEAAASGFQRRADTYQRARPTYHPELVRRVVERYGHGDLVEIGAGTGIFTGLLIAAGLSVTVVEPVEAMRSVLRATVGVEALEGTAESIPIGGASVDCVVAAQAFHWFNAPVALDEIVRVLRPGGHLVTVWNVRDESVAWVVRYSEVVERHAGDTPRYASFEWRRAIDRDDRFRLVDEWAVDNPVPTDASGVVDRAMSTSFIATLDADTQHKVAEELRAIVAGAGPDLVFPYRGELQAWQVR